MLLIWAVCGAGKTEILFAGIERAIQQGLTVCMAAPRTDVILELAPRLRGVFVENNACDLVALYGGSEDQGHRAQLTLATTHQLLRYRDHFDVMIIDEVDAFPFSLDDSLQYAATKAKTSEATTLLLSATPSQAQQQRVQQKELSCVEIPRRFHGYDLPVPRLVWCGHWEKRLNKQKLPRVVFEWTCQQLSAGRPAFLFVPSVHILTTVTQLLQKEVDERIVSVHANDEERRETVVRFREGEIPLLVTTTILERGVTIPDVQVAVFGADHDLFTEGALVQMAGRVGRHPNHPKGDVVFFHYGKSQGMVAAKRHIKRMNHQSV